MQGIHKQGIHTEHNNNHRGRDIGSDKMTDAWSPSRLGGACRYAQHELASEINVKDEMVFVSTCFHFYFMAMKSLLEQK